MLVYIHIAFSALCYCWFAAGLAKTPDDAAKTQPQSDLANICHMLCQESACSSDFMIQVGRPHTKLTWCSQLLKKEMGKKTPTIHQTKNPTTLQLDDIPDTLAQKIRMFGDCYALRVNRSLWFGDMMHLPSLLNSCLSVQQANPFKIKPSALYSSKPHSHTQLKII